MKINCIKYQLVAVLTFFLSGSLLAQLSFVGTSKYGGDYDAGAVFMVDSDGNSELIHSYERGVQRPTSASFVLGSNGNLLGLSYYGGSRDFGTVYEFDLTLNQLTKHADLTQEMGRNPFGNLVKASDGYYYGFGYSGGIFRYDENTHETVALTTSALDQGSSPLGSPLEIEPGVLLGITFYGGSSSKGTIFKYDINTGVATTLQSLDDSTGYQARMYLMKTSTGKVYGCTIKGGANGQGTVIKYDYNTNTLTRVANLESAPYYGTLTEADNGKLLGYTEKGGASGFGTILEIDTTADTVSTIFEFTNATTEGKFPRGGLTKGSGNKFYGTTYQGGTSWGTLFEFDYTSKTITVLNNFVSGGLDGENLYNPVFVHPTNNKLYGVSFGGGAYSLGVLYEYDLGSGTFTKLHDFEGAPGGAEPNSTMIQASNGMVYGATNDGGNAERGTFFEVDPVSKTYRIVRVLQYQEPYQIKGKMIEGPDGKIYGTSVNGGSGNRGTIFTYDPVLDTIEVLYDFTTASIYYIWAGLAWNADSTLLYGCGTNGGTNGKGAMYTFDPVSKAYNEIHQFNSATDGNAPEEALLLASDGKFYGSSDGGGASSAGTIISYDPNTSTFTKILDYGSTPGVYGEHSFIEGKNGDLITGLRHSTGRMIAYNIYSGTTKTLFDAAGTGGRTLAGLPVLAPDSNSIYGLFAITDTSDHGIVYQYFFDNDSIAEIARLDSINALYADGDLTIVGCDGPVSMVNSSDTTLCEGTSINLEITATGYDSRVWLQDGDSVAGDLDNLTFSNLQLSDSGYYSQLYRSICGITESNQVLLQIEAQPLVDAGTDTVLCDGDSLTLMSEGNAVTNTWDNGVTDGVSFVPDSTTTYTLTGASANGCESTDMITVQVGLMPEITDNNGTLTTGVYTTYQWYKDGSIINGATSQEYTPTESGSYTVEVSNGNCTETSEALTFSMAGIADDENLKFNVYPNPSSGIVHVELDMISVSGTRLWVRNSNGQLVRELYLSDNVISLDLPKGVYSVTVLTRSKNETRKLLIF